MAIDRPDDRRTSTRVQHEDVESEAMTIEDIYASMGKGTPPDLEEGVFHAQHRGLYRCNAGAPPRRLDVVAEEVFVGLASDD